MRSGLHSRALPSGVGRSNIFTVAKAELEVLRKKAKEIESLVCQFIIKGHMWVLLPLARNSQRPFPGSKEGMSPSEEHLEAASMLQCMLPLWEDSSLGLCSGSQVGSITNASLSHYMHSSYNSLLVSTVFRPYQTLSGRWDFVKIVILIWIKSNWVFWGLFVIHIKICAMCSVVSDSLWPHKNIYLLKERLSKGNNNCKPLLNILCLSGSVFMTFLGLSYCMLKQPQESLSLSFYRWVDWGWSTWNPSLRSQLAGW